MDRDQPAFVAAPRLSRRPGFTVVQWAVVGAAALLGVLAVAFMAGVFDGRNGYAQNAKDQPLASADVLTKLNHFKNWQKPDLVLVLSGEQHGYLQPCGCTEPMYGGLTRRYNLFQALWARGWPTVAVDLGDIPAEKQTPQILLKYRTSLAALVKMGYGAVGIGALEMNTPLMDAMAETLNHASPKILCANLIRTGSGQAFAGTVFDWELVKQPKAPVVGVVGIAGKLDAKIGDPNVKLDPNTPKILLDSLLASKKSGAELLVVLYQGDGKDATACATFCHKAHKDNPTQVPRVDVMLCLGEQLPPAAPVAVVGGETVVVTVGHKGQHVGVVGVFRRPNQNPPFELRYELVRMDPEFGTPAGMEKNHVVMQLMEQYAKDVHDDNYLRKYKKTTHEVQVNFPNASYVGSAACQSCHKHAYKIWEKSKHAHAYDTLVKAKNPSLRQFDGECVVCHTVGFEYKTGFAEAATTPHLLGVGCESCHGPCSEHVAKPRNPDIHKVINKSKNMLSNLPVRERQVDMFCQKCHDLENDNGWALNKRWPVIEHLTPANPGVGAAPTPPLVAQQNK